MGAIMTHSATTSIKMGLIRWAVNTIRKGTILSQHKKTLRAIIMMTWRTTTSTMMKRIKSKMMHLKKKLWCKSMLCQHSSMSNNNLLLTLPNYSILESRTSQNFMRKKTFSDSLRKRYLNLLIQSWWWRRDLREPRKEIKTMKTSLDRSLFKLITRIH